MPLSEIPPPMESEPGADPPLVRVRPPGPMSRGWMARLERTESPAFGARRQTREAIAGEQMAPIVYASGIGSNVVDVDGNRYVDLAAGFGSILLGHGASRVERSLEMQAHRLYVALGDMYSSDAKIALVEKVAALYPKPGARALLGQSGSDAVEAGLKTACLATGKPGVVAFEGSYHGLGYGPLPACGLKASWRDAFAAQLSSHVGFAPYPASDAELDASLSAVGSLLKKGDVGAILVEPILGRGGCVVPPVAFLRELSQLARKAGALLIADEIWTGLGRSGRMLYSSASEVVPDLVLLGKGLGGGLPLSACIGSDEVMQAWRRDPGHEVVHTATFNGAPLACSTAIATLDAIRSGKLVERSAEVGARMRTSLLGTLALVPGVGAIRGAGLMIGIPLGTAATTLTVQRELLEDGYIVSSGGIAGDVLILTPALTISEDLLDAFLVVLRGILEGRRQGEGAS